MRRGYWKTLLRSLRSRVAGGDNAVLLAGHSLTLTDILASGEETLDGALLLPLAVTANGWQILIEPASSHVLLLQGTSQSALPLGLELAAFIDALARSSAAVPELKLELGAVIDEGALLLPRRGLLEP